MRRALFLSFAIVLGAAMAAPTTAAAQSVDINTPHTGDRPFQLDIHGGFTWWGLGLATGARFGIPILNNGFVDSINNAVYINFGFDFYFIRRIDCGGRGCRGEYGPGFGIPVTLHWEFYFSETWSVFAELGFQFFAHPDWLAGQGFRGRDAGMWFVLAVGGSLHLSENVLLTLRVGNPYIAFGVTFQF